MSVAACPDPSGKSRELCDSGNEQQTTNLSVAACPDPSGKSRELCDSGNEQKTTNNKLERSSLPRPIGEIPRALRFGKQTKNNEQQT
ncbi:MAG: hypothetical protein EOM83_14385 [Clostridia bacterium]|nr:hypothetical protein [Clostridia bacterium]